VADTKSTTRPGAGPASDPARPPLAVVGSQISHDEELFGRVFDKWVARRFLTFLGPYRSELYLAIGAVLVFTLTQLSIPLIIRAVIDDAVVAESAARAQLDTLAMVFAAVIIVNYVANHAQETIVGKVAEHLLFDLRRAMYAHLQLVSLSFMDKTEVGRLMSRLQGDVYALQEFLESSIFAIGDLVLLLGIIAALLSLDFQLGVMTLSVVPILFLVRIVWLPYARRAFLWARETSSNTNGALAENIHGIRAVQEMGREAINYDLFDEKATENLNAHLSASKFSNVMIPIVDTLTGGALAIVVVVGGSLVLDGALDIGIMVAFVFYVQRFFDPIRSLTIQYSMMQRAMAAGQRIFEVLDVAVEVQDKPDAIDPGEIDGAIEFRNVTFGYVPDQPVLKDISFSVAPGETVALVGPTGSGKSTLLNMLGCLDKPDQGSYHLDGDDVAQLDSDELSQVRLHKIGFVFQAFHLLTGYSALDNVADGLLYTGMSLDDRRARAYEALVTVGLGNRLDHVATQLSGGEGQRVAIARAIVGDHSLVLADEPTGNLDTQTSEDIVELLHHLNGAGTTIVVVTHDLEIAESLPRIVRLRDGRIESDRTKEPA